MPGEAALHQFQQLRASEHRHARIRRATAHFPQRQPRERTAGQRPGKRLPHRHQTHIGLHAFAQRIGHQVAHATLTVGGKIKRRGQLANRLAQEVRNLGFEPGHLGYHRQRLQAYPRARAVHSPLR